MKAYRVYKKSKKTERFDVQNYLQCHDIIFQQPPEIWQEGLYIGNGDMVCVYFADPDAFCWGIDKVDCFDSRVKLNPERGTHHQKLLDLLRKKDLEGAEQLFQETRWPVHNYPYPNKKACGLLKIKIDGLDNYNLNHSEYEQRTSIAKGVNIFSLLSEDLKLECESFVHKDENVLCIRLRGCSTTERSVSIYFERWLDPAIGKPVFKQGKLARRFSIVHKINNKDAYALGGAVEGLAGKMKLTDNSYTLQGKVSPGRFDFQVYIAVENQEAKELSSSSVVRMLDRAIARGYRSLLRENVRVWKKFWEKSFLWNEDKFFEQVYYVTFYHVAIAVGKSSLPATTLYPGALVDYFDYGHYLGDSNIEMAHWPLLPANHPELMEPYYEFFARHLGKMRRETKKQFDIRGISIPFSFGVDGTLFGDTWARHMQQPSGWVAELLWWYYEFTQDKELLREKLYPFIKEVARFYINYMTPDSQGRLSVYPSCPPEQVNEKHEVFWVRNDSAARSVVYVALKAAAEACHILNIDPEFEAECSKTLENLADYPNDGNVLLDFEGAPADLELYHCALLNGVYSTGEINLWGNKRLLQLAKRTYAGIFDRTHHIRTHGQNPWKIKMWTDDVMNNWLICVAARLGEQEKAWACLHDQIFLMQLRENGTLTGHESVFPQNLRQPHGFYLNHISGTMNSILEMYIQSHTGVIQAFPGIPAKYDGGFHNLLARGAFEISAQRKKGVVRHIGIRSLAGLPCKVLNPWKDTTANVYQGSKKIATIAPGSEFIEFNTAKGNTYLIRPAKGGAKELAFPKSTGILACPRSYKGPQYLGRVTNEAKPEVVTIGKVYSKRDVYRFSDDGDIKITPAPYSVAYSTGNYWYFCGAHHTFVPYDTPEHGLKVKIYDLKFGGPYPEFAEYWINCKKVTQAEITFTYKHNGVKPKGALTRLLVNGEIVTDSLFMNTSDELGKEFTHTVGPVELNKGMNIVHIERNGHIPLVLEVELNVLSSRLFLKGETQEGFR